MWPMGTSGHTGKILCWVVGTRVLIKIYTLCILYSFVDDVTTKLKAKFYLCKVLKQAEPIKGEKSDRSFPKVGEE